MQEKSAQSSDLPEPAISTTHAEVLNDQIYKEDNAVLVDLGAADGDNAPNPLLKLSKDGHTVLIPQPSDDPSDPLNWSWFKKHAILLTIGFSGWLAEFQAASGPSCIVLQGVEWNMNPNHVNEANNLCVLFVGLGGIFAIPFLYFWGRAPLMLWSVFLGAMFTLGCTLAPSFGVFYAMRALQGFAITGGQTSGLAFIHDIFFFHEQARKIGIWTVMFVAAPYFGPMFANYVLAGTGQWRNVYWLVFGSCCLNIVLVLLFLDETWYRRDINISDQPPKSNRLARVIGLWQIRYHHGYFGTVSSSCHRMWSVFWKPIIIPAMLYYMMNFMWAVGINQTAVILFATPRSAGGYGFGAEALGYCLFAPIIGVACGEVFGHFFNDLLAARFIRRHKGVFVPEARLTPIYISAIFMIPGLVLVGQTLERHLHWAGIVVGWGMFVFGCMVASVAIVAYLVDTYPSAAGEISSLINLARLLGGFSVGYFQLDWGLKEGFDVSFGVQAAIVAAGVLIIPILHIWGPKLRHRGGPLRF